MKKLSSPIDLIKRSVDIFSKKKNLIFFLEIYLLILPFSVFSVVQNFVPALQNLQLTYSWQLGLNLLLNVGYLLVSALVGVSVISSFRTVLGNEKLSVIEALRKSCAKYWWPYFLLTIVVAIITGLGFVLLIVPGVLFLTWFSFARFILVEKGSKIKESLVTSRNLVKGKFWKIFGRLIVFGVFELVVEFIFSTIPYGIGTIFTGFLGALFILPPYLLYKELE